MGKNKPPQKHPTQQASNLPSKQTITTKASVAYFGPIPDPFTLQKYESIVPGAAERILKQAESQTNHRQQLERMVIESGIEREKQGLIFGFIGLILILGAVLICAYLKQQIIGAALGGGGIAG